jgi:membrane-associated phospholipid phosphatase
MNPHTRHLIVALLLAWLASALVGCATAPIRTEDGADLPLWPNGQRWKKASLNGLRDPITWGGAAGAAVVAIWDKKISRWAVENTPVFGSVDHAKSASDDLRSLCGLGMLGTALAVPGGDHPWRSRAERILVEEGGVWSASSVTNLMKEGIHRERPDEADNHSFPSGHSTRAFAYNGMSLRNLDAIELPDGGRLSLKFLFTTLAAGTAWARVEGERHYPSDVFAGAAIGNFVSLLIHDAFLGRTEKVNATLRADHDERSLNVAIVFP